MLFLASPVNVGDGSGIKGKKNARRRYRENGKSYYKEESERRIEKAGEGVT